MSTTLEAPILSFSPAHKSCRHVAFSRKSDIFNSRMRFFCNVAVLTGAAVAVADAAVAVAAEEEDDDPVEFAVVEGHICENKQNL